MTAVPIHNGSLDLPRAVARIDGVEHPLTALEVRFLERVIATPGVVVSYEVLLREVWEADPRVQSRAVEALVARLRKKLGEDARRPVHLRTVHGIGLAWESGAAPAPSGWIGREAERARLASLLRAPGLVTLVGLPGSGKTRLARLVAPSAPVVVARPQLVEAIGEALGLVPAAAVDRERVLEAARARPVLILDDLDPEHTDAELLAALAQVTAVVATSARPVGVMGEQVVGVGPLPPDERRELLRNRLEAVGVALPPTELERVANTLDGFPLEVEIVAGALAVVGPELPASVSRLDLVDDGPVPRSLRRAFARAWAAVPPDDRAVMGALARFERDFDLEAAAEVSGRPLAEVLPVLQRQVRRAWVITPRGGWFRLPASVRTFVAETCADSHAAAGPRWLSFCAGLERHTLIEGVDRVERYLDDLLVAGGVAEGSELLCVLIALREVSERRPAVGRVRPVMTAARLRCDPPLRDTVLGLAAALTFSHPHEAEDRELRAELFARRAAGATDPVLLRALLPLVPPDEVPELVALARRSVATSPDPIRLRYQSSLAALAGEGPEGMVEVGRYARAHGLHHLAKLARLGEGRALFLAGRLAEATEVFSEVDDHGAIEGGVGLEVAICALSSGDTAGALRVLDLFVSVMGGHTGYGAIAQAARAIVLHGSGKVKEARLLARELHLSDKVPMASLLPLVEVERGGRPPPIRDPVLDEVRLAWLGCRSGTWLLRGTSSVLLCWWLTANAGR
ncbi:MAG: winged helix-turn-helix domain-containing protein [Myxococcota bacterium]